MWKGLTFGIISTTLGTTGPVRDIVRHGCSDLVRPDARKRDFDKRRDEIQDKLERSDRYRDSNHLAHLNAIREARPLLVKQ
jgi:hypothetical protein